MKRILSLFILILNVWIAFGQDDLLTMDGEVIPYSSIQQSRTDLRHGHQLVKTTLNEPIAYWDSLSFNGVTLFRTYDSLSFYKCPVYVKSFLKHLINIPQPHFFRSNLTALDVKTDAILDDMEGTYEEVDSLAYDDRFVYQDEDYHVSQTCAGEWGSIIYFYDLKKGIRKECGGMGSKWTSFIRVGQKYIMSNSRCIVEYDPSQMIRSKGVRSGKPYHTSNDGSRVLFKAPWEGPRLHASFVCQDTFYFIYNDGSNYCIGFLKDGQIEYVATLCKSIGFYDEHICTLSVDAHTLVVAVRKPRTSEGYSSLWVLRDNSWQILDMEITFQGK